MIKDGRATSSSSATVILANHFMYQCFFLSCSALHVPFSSCCLDGRSCIDIAGSEVLISLQQDFPTVSIGPVKTYFSSALPQPLFSCALE